ncbi:MAG: hypothetical protein KU38_02565 [Sulfurovum sp. FS08-3]|nr:MAG: hypothetical protein KU38_02565 [Sulfurovum sp. FS08-3]
MAYTQAQIDKYNRQRYITHLEKITKNLYKMLREESTTQEKFINKFHELKTALNKLPQIELYTSHHKEIVDFINAFYKEATGEDFVLEDVRQAQMSNLNRLQKSKNNNTYKKLKHKNSFNEW